MNELNRSLNNNSQITESLNSSMDNSKRFTLDNFKSSTPIATKFNIRTKNDSAYSSFVSNQNHFYMNSNPSLIKENNFNYESPGTSYSSRNSAGINEDEMEDIFPKSETFNSVESEPERCGATSFFISDTLYRRSARNSPWTNRPDSAPLNEEEEDSDKEASNYLFRCKDNLSNLTILPEIVQSTLQGQSRVRHCSMTDSNQRKDIIAMKLQQIADKMPQKRMRHKSCVEHSKKRHSLTSFTEMMPNSMGSALDLFLSLLSIYKQHSNKSTNKAFSNSQSLQNMKQPHQRTNSRSRSYTE